jgi:hypothetical protein
MLAHAGRIEISEPECQAGDIVLHPEDLTGFVFAPVDGGGQIRYCNQTGEDWTKLTIAIRTSAPASSVICPSASPSDPSNDAHLAFSTCQVFATGPEPNTLYVRLFGTIAPDPLFPGDNGFLGVPIGEEFTIKLDCVEGDEFCTPWPADTFMVAAANGRLPHVPEPASLALLGSGLAAAIIRRKVRI